MRIAAATEAVTLLVLLLNLATVHEPRVAGVVGPVHGAAYLTAIVAVLLHDVAPRATRWWGAFPGGGAPPQHRPPRAARCGAPSPGVGGLVAVRLPRPASAAPPP